jgi:enterochelin esterase-like enzyme
VINAIATQVFAGWVGVDVKELLFDKNDARVGRVLALIATASLLYAGLTVAWRPARRVTGWLALPLGQSALFAYGVQLFVVAFWSSELMAPVRLDRENALFQGAAVLMVWGATLLRPHIASALSDARTWAVGALDSAAHTLRNASRPRLGARTSLALAAVLLAGCSFARVTDATMLVRAAPAATIAPMYTFEPAEVSEVAVDPGPGRAEEGTFYSAALKRTMRYVVYLPAAYDDTTARFSTLYMLHGGSGELTEWVDYGLFSTADELIREGSIAPMIIVLPEGDQEYWVDHVVDASTGANGEKWGTYTAKDVVTTIDARYRTIANAQHRAIGGLSMGGHGAIQLALNFPGTWSIVGAHSPSLRPEADAPTYLGKGAQFAARDPYALIAAKPTVARAITWWIDTGDVDPWRAQAMAISDELTSLGIADEWHEYSGDHSAAYWSAHTRDYLAFYANAFASR